MSYENGDEEKLLTEIDGAFGADLQKGGMLFIGQYSETGFEGDATREYHIPLEVESVGKRRAGRMNI